MTAGDAGGLAWVVYQIGAGRVAADPDDASKATYTAPNPAGATNQARVVAYLVDDEAARVWVWRYHDQFLMVRKPRNLIVEIHFP